MNAVATAAGVVLGVSGADLSEIHDTVEKLEGLGNKNLVIDVTGADVKETFKMQFRSVRQQSKTVTEHSDILLL